MQSSLEKLRKFFRLEAENKYANTAVIGGLAKILDFWEAEARNEGLSEDLIQLVASRLHDYQRLTPTSRADTLKGVWKRIQGQIPNTEMPNPVYADDLVTKKSEPAQELPPAPVEEPISHRPRSHTPTPVQATPQPQAQAQTQPQPQPKPKPQPERKPTPSRASSYPGAQTSQTPAALSARLTVLQGVGPKNAASLEKMGMFTLGDMLYYFPRRYDDYSQLKPIRSLEHGEVVTVIGQIQSVFNRPIRGGKMQMVEAIISDGTGALRISWFNQPWLMNRLSEGMN
ncbi:MAG: hypothetical protein WCK35_15945, partial [Chloroflexota bacterium]